MKNSIPTPNTALPRHVLQALPRPPWTEDRAAMFDNSDLAGLSPVEKWAKKKEAENALYYFVSSGRDTLVWSPWNGGPGSATFWLKGRVSAVTQSTRAASR